MESLVRANIHFLNQAERFLIQVSDQDYGSEVESFYRSTLGQHMRHSLDHYRALLSGLPEAKIDYDHRARLRLIEASTECAIAEVQAVRSKLEALLRCKPPVGLLVKMDCGGDCECDVDWQPSTLGRELQFLVSHTIHHFAMIGGICGCLGIEIENGFGMAPSTLRHREITNID
ncbi:MAG: hypothetical protein ACN4GG_11160 [Akkermansiaceae bacterium]